MQLFALSWFGRVIPLFWQIASQCQKSFACSGTTSRKMQQVLLGHGANINAQTEFGFSILHIAVSFAAHKMRDFLLEQNIQVDLEDIDGRTALFNAIAANDLESSRALVNAGGSCLHLDSQSVCPLQIAVSTGNLQIVEFILNCSKSLVNHQNEFGFSVLHTLALFPR